MESREFGTDITNTFQAKTATALKSTKQIKSVPVFHSLISRGRAKLDSCEVFSVAFSRRGHLLAAGLQNGSMQIVEPVSFKVLKSIKDDSMNLPVTQLAWRPLQSFQFEGTTPNTLLGSCCDGTVLRWTENRPDEAAHIKLTEGCEYRCVNYSYTGRRFVVAGSKGHVEVYDDDIFKLVSCFPDEKKHKNTVFAAKFFPESESLLISGSWDRQVKIWDVRVKGQSQVMYGPMTQGDTLDMQSDGCTILTAGSIGGASFHTYDLRNLSKGPTLTVGWGGEGISSPMLNVLRFLRGQNILFACANDAKEPAQLNHRRTYVRYPDRGSSWDRFRHKS